MTILLALALSQLCAAPEQQAIDGAIGKAVAWLKKEQSPNGAVGSNAGETALALMALRHCRVPAGDPACEKAARRLERVLPDGSVYGAALGVLALLAQSPERHKKEIRRLVDDLVKGQCVNGQWSYSYRKTARKKAGDNSNTQIAILAMAAARARRVPVPPHVFERCEAFFLGTQNPDGGYGYSDKQRKSSYASMTAGGAMALQICAAGKRDVNVNDPSLRDLPAVKRALAWLGNGFRPGLNTGSAAAFGSKKGRRSDTFWRYYWLWSLERACSTIGVDRIGGHDWYGEGAAFLLKEQHEQGKWRGPEKSLQGTCFALWFLSRSTVAVTTPREKDKPVTTGK